jgi:hypothetical protein
VQRISKKDPARAADLVLRMFEYFIPKVSRLESAWWAQLSWAGAGAIFCSVCLVSIIIYLWWEERP